MYDSRTVFVPFAAVILLTISAAAQTATSSDAVPAYKPISGVERMKWFANSTVGPMSLFASGPLSAAWGTALNSPEEYGPHWEGFGKRYGMRLTGVSTGNAMEAALGAAWGEDPRYFRSTGKSFGGRVKYVVKATFMAPNRNGEWRPAYARQVGNVGNNFLSNLWRVDSENDPGDAALRCVWGALGKMGGNAFAEFWPDVKRLISRKKSDDRKP